MPVRRKLTSFLLLLLLVGCGGGESSRVSTLPRVSGPAVPVATAASDATPEGAAAFARYFFAQITQAFATADPDLVSALSQPGCTTCRRFIDSLTELRDEHERVTPVTFTVRFAEAPPSDGRTARVDIQYDVPASTRYDASGKVLFREAATVKGNAVVHLVRIGGSWRVSEIA